MPPVVQANKVDDCVQKDQTDARTMAITWGATLANEGVKSSNARAARAQWILAGRCYRQAAQIDPTDSEAFSGWGMALSLEAWVLGRTDLTAARAMFRQTGQKFEQALKLDPRNASAAFQWGIALSDEAKALADAVPSDLAGASILWKQARQKYALGLQLDPSDVKIVDNWGGTFAIEAGALAASNLPAARELWKQAYDRFEVAVRIDPKFVQASNNFAAAMLQELAALLKASPELRYQADSEMIDLLQKVKKILLALENNAAGDGAYNLACMYALEGQATDAMQWLERSAVAGKLPEKSHIASDSNLDSLRNTPAFRAWFEKLP